MIGVKGSNLTIILFTFFSNVTRDQLMLCIVTIKISFIVYDRFGHIKNESVIIQPPTTTVSMKVNYCRYNTPFLK
jgi:TRAP-type uncharacterized transport system fused permease subunit